MRRFQGGDEEAFRELVGQFKEPITAFAARMLNSYEKGLDIAQETFIRVFTHADSYRPLGGFSAWLYRIAYNLAINEIRQQRRQPVIVPEGGWRSDGQDHPLAEARGTELSPEEAMLGRERCDVVRRCVATLPAKYRGVIVMKDMEGLTFDVIARILDCPESTVKSRVMRGRRMLGKKLAPYLNRRQSQVGTPRPVRSPSES